MEEEGREAELGELRREVAEIKEEGKRREEQPRNVSVLFFFHFYQTSLFLYKLQYLLKLFRSVIITLLIGYKITNQFATFMFYYQRVHNFLSLLRSYCQRYALEIYGL